MKKNCKHCGVEFEAKVACKVFCGKKCNANHYARSEKGKAKLRENYIARYEPRSEREQLEKECEHCGSGFRTPYSFKRFCSYKCADDSYNVSDAGRKAQARYRASGKKTKTEEAWRRSDEYKEARKGWDKKWMDANREKVDAHIKARGVPLEPCVVCGDEKSQRHHPDYSKPLEVVFLCDKHHKEEHKIINV